MHYYGALEAGGTKMVCAVCDENGNILERVSIPTKTPAETMPEMIAFFRGYPIRALGIGSFGPVDLDKNSPTYGSFTTTPKLAWANYPIVAEFKQALNVPVGFDTDVNAAALGEATFGCTQGLDSSVYITVGTGVGLGILINGKPYHGLMHPEGGHVLLVRHPDDPMPRGICPYHPNCLEGLTCGPALEVRWGAKGPELADRKEVWEIEAYYIAQAITDYIMVLSPRKIVLGGGVMHQEGLIELIRAEVGRLVNDYLRVDSLHDLDNYIVPPSLNDNQGILGALQLAIEAAE